MGNAGGKADGGVLLHVHGDQAEISGCTVDSTVDEGTDETTAGAAADDRMGEVNDVTTGKG